MPTPATPTLRPRSVGSPQACWALARMPWKTPKAVRTEESPAPPFSGERPVVQLALAGDDVHVGDVGADVAGGDVAAAEGGHEPAVGEQQLLGLDLHRDRR